MRVAPDRFLEDIRIFRVSRPDDTDTDRLFDDPFVEPVDDRYSGYTRQSQGYIIAEGKAKAQEDRVNVHRSSPKVKLDAVSFFNMYFILRSWTLPPEGGRLPAVNFGSLNPADRVYLLRMSESPNFLYRHVCVHWHEFSRGQVQIYTTDAREGHRTSATLT